MKLTGVVILETQGGRGGHKMRDTEREPQPYSSLLLVGEDHQVRAEPCSGGTAS